MKLAIVSYLYPDTANWNRIIAVRPDLVILNPSNGPGNVRDDNYAALHAKLIAARIPTLGYISTRYGDRPIWECDADRTAFRSLYGPMSGFFWDEQRADADRYFFYHSLCREGDINVLNPGAFCSEKYSDLGIVAPYECDVTTYITRTPKEWMKRTRTWHIIYGVKTSTSMRTVLTLALQRSAAYVWICTDNEYNSLPPYFEEMKSLLAL